MSYIAAFHPEPAACTRVQSPAAPAVRPRLAMGRGAPGRLSGSLEALLLVGTLSALSLALCVVAAGAF